MDLESLHMVSMTGIEACIDHQCHILLLLQYHLHW